MILILLIPRLLACEFNFVYNQDMKEISYDIPPAEFTALGIWTRYYAFYLDIGIKKEKYYLGGVYLHAYKIITASFNNGWKIDFYLEKYGRRLFYSWLSGDYSYIELSNDQPHEGVWMFTYIGIDNNSVQTNVFLVNTKTDKFFTYLLYKKKNNLIKSVKLFGEDYNLNPFSGQISFTYSQSSLVKFNEGQQLLTHLKSCDTSNSCTNNKINQILSGIMDKFNGPFKVQVQNNYQIDGWFKFIPDTQIQNYNNLILQIVQYDQQFLKYNGIIPLKISLNFDKTNLSNNGILVETSSFKNAIWDDYQLNPIRVEIFDELYLDLLQSWVYFRFLQYEQIDRTAEFFLSFSDSSQVNKNMGKLNLFKFGQFYIYLGQSKLNQTSFLGQLADFNIQSCLQSYPRQLLACEFKLIYNQDMKEVSYDIPQAEFTALGIWTRYYAFYLDIGIQKEPYQEGVYAYQIMMVYFNDEMTLDYKLLKSGSSLYHQWIINKCSYQSEQLNNQKYEGVWMFTYIGIDKNSKQMNIFLVNTQTDQFELIQHYEQIYQIKSVELFGDDYNLYPFSGQISFIYSQSSLVKFDKGEQLLFYLKSCNMENQCNNNKINQILSGIMDKFNGPFKVQMQNNYWIAGWFKFTPDTQIQNYSNLILQIVQYDQELLKYNGIIPLKISLNFDKNNLSNNGIIVETSTFKNAIWDDDQLNPIRLEIFDELYLELLQSWVYLRFLQYEQIDRNAEFFLSFSDSSQVNKNMGKLNLFKFGQFYIYLGQSKLNQTRFLGQLANFNFQSCLYTYPQQLLAGEFNFIYNQDMKEVSYDIPPAEFTALGIWTRYYAFYLDIGIQKEQHYLGSVYLDAYQIMTASFNDGLKLDFYLEIFEGDIHYSWLAGEDYGFIPLSNDQPHEGVWMFTYIGIDSNSEQMDIFFVNTKTDKFYRIIFQKKKNNLIKSVKLFGEDYNLYPFSGQISFTYSQISLVKFNDGQQLVTHLKACDTSDSCTNNKINQILSGIIDQFNGPFKFQMQNNYWIDGWFKFTPDTQIQNYSNLILQIVQYDQELLKYNGIIPLKISLNFDKNNLRNNGIIVEIPSYKNDIKDDYYYQLPPQIVKIFDEQYLELLQSWVYFRFLQYEQIDSTAEFFLSFLDSSQVNKNMGQINLFKFGQFYIYLGQSKLNQTRFLGQLANFNIQSCLQSYPQAKRPSCHFQCLTCMGPLENNCLSCVDETQNNRILNPYTNTCDCKQGFISGYGKVECMDIERLMKSAIFKQFQIQQIQIQHCKNGQFQYQIGQLIKCYDCPQQSSSGLLCADCLENLFTWQKNMKCSYDYYQDNNNNNNTYIKYQRPENQIEFYYVQDDLLLICLGCIFNEGSYQIVKGKTSLYGKCYQNYYYKDQSCHPCQQNCEVCENNTGRCNFCKTGFAIKEITNDQICKSCPDYCLKCSQLDNISLCQQCLDGFTPGEGICQRCGTNCLICDYDIKLNRPKCRVCKYSGYFLPFDGFDCIENTIQNCQIQYQELIQISQAIKITLGFQSNNWDDSSEVITTINNCALCEIKFMNGNTYCQYNHTLKSDEQVVLNNSQQINLLEFTNSLSASCQIDQCTQCILEQFQKYSLKCIKCSQGYYADIMNGFCVSCPSSSNCQTCHQQNREYKDGWKWSIRRFSSYKFKGFIDLVTETSSQEVICLTCLQGYFLYDNKCILDCPKNCNRCTIINGENVCTFCGSSGEAKLLTIYNNQCINCPSNCDFCRARSESDVYSINSLFNPDDPLKYYYSYICLKQTKDDVQISFNQFLQQYIKCQDERLCMKQINIKLKAYCDLPYYSIQKNESATSEDFLYENIYIDDQMPFSNIETPQFFEYLNGIQVESLIYELTLISPSNNCKISNVITTHASKNVFSLTKTKLIINANNLTLNSLKGQIQNFSEVEIQQSKLDSPFYINLYHPNQLIVRFKDISFVSKQINDIQMIIMNPSRIEINNFSIQSIQNSSNNIISYEYTNTSNVKQLSVIMDSLLLINGSFYDVDFLNLKADFRIFNVMINISNSIIESRFYNSSFIKEQSMINYGQIYLNNVTFIVQVEQASLINLNGQFNLSSQGKLIGNFTSSNFLKTNQLKIANSYIYNTSLNNSTLIDNQISKQDLQIHIHEINNLEFKWIQIDESSNLITIIDKNIQDSLLIQNLFIINCSFINKKQTKVQQRLIIFEGAIFKIFNSHFQKNILGFTDISIKQCQSVIIDSVTVVGTNVQGLLYKLDCYQKSIQISSQNGFIEMENILSVLIQNSQFSNIMIQDQPIIKIFCFNNTIKQQIQIINSKFINNLILKIELSSQNAIFQLLSLGSGNFQAMNVSFTENVLNEYQQTQFSNSATTFLIEAEQFNITLNNMIFDKNQIFNSSDSILYIKAKLVIIQNSTYTQSNLYDDFILRFVIWGSQSNEFYQENFQQIFPILSLGGNAKFIAEKLFISFCQFSHSTAQSGSGFHLTLQNQLSISDTTFLDLRNKVDKEDSYGGSIYISLVALNATIEIKNSKFENSSSLSDGGAIYINSRYTTSNITLQSISVYNCYSFKGLFISVIQNKHSIIKITNINVRNNEQGFKDFLSQFQELSVNQVEQFHYSALFYVSYGSLYISDSIISYIQLSGVLYFYSGYQLSIYDLIIQNIQFSSLGLIQIYPTSNINAVTLIQNIQILNCNNVQPLQIFCKNKLKSQSNDFECNNYLNKPSSLTTYPQDLQEKSNCFYNKLLDFESSSSMIYVGMIQITDYFYISDLNMRNNNCSFCKDGMMRINNVEINIPEYNNIILRQIKFENNICGSGCLVISQQQYINFITGRLLQNLLYQARFNIPFTIIFEQSEFFNNSAQNGILIVSNLSISIIDAKFIKNIGFGISGGILFLGNQNHTFQIMTSEISDSIGNEGGAFYLGNRTISNTELLQILLSQNKAKSFGQDLVSISQALTISLDGGKTFKQTKYITKSPQIIEEIIIKPYRILGNNTLQQFLTLPSGYKIKNYQYYDEKLKSFTPYSISFRLIALNNLKQQIKNLQNSYCKIQKRKININTNDDGPFEEFVQKIEYNTTTQDYNLDELIINFDPYLSYDYVLQLKFNCSSVYIPIVNNTSPYNIIGYSNNYDLRMNIRTFQCQRGESYSAQEGTCILCNSSLSQYSVVIKASKCSAQDEITMKNVTSTLIELREKYWRPYDDNNIVAYCYNFPFNCNGGWITGDESCALGHIGALCEQCDLYNTRGSGSYATSGQFQCGSCSNLSLNTLQIFLIIIWTLVSILLSVKGTVENVDEYIIRMKAIKVGFVCIYYERVQIGVLMKILTNYLQIISSIGTFQLKLPSGLKSIFTYSGNPIKSAMNSLDCFLIELSNISILYFRNIWFIFMPIYYSTVIFLIYFLLIKLKYMDFKITVLSTTLIFIFIYVQPDIIGSFISLVSYRKISQVLWVQGNVSYLYLTPVHTRWLFSFVIPILIVFGFLIPIILYIKMSKYKDKLNDMFVLRLYGYLYNEYSKAAYYWEIIKICQKELIIIFLTFYEDVIIIKGTIIFIIIFFYDIISKKYKPYKRVDLNKLDSQSSFVCAFSTVIGMAIYFADYNGNSEVLWPFYLLMGIFNIYFILRLITLLLIGYFDKLSDKIDQIRDYINNKHPTIIENYPQFKKYLENSKMKSKRVKQRFLKLREYLWEIVKQNRKNQRLETESNQDDEKKESKQDFKNKELNCDANQSIQLQSQSYKSKKQSLIPLQDIDQGQINISLDIQKQNDRQFEISEKIDNQDNPLKKSSESDESLPIQVESINELDFKLKVQDIQNNNDEEEQLNLSFQQ